MPIYPLDSIPTRTLAGLIAGILPPDDISQEQWDEIIEIALDHGVGGMLLWSQRQSGWVHPGDPGWQLLIETSRRNGRHNLLIEKARKQVAAALDKGSVPAIWLKGAALAHTHYPEPHLRPMADLDFLVHPAKMAAAREVLHDLSFRPAEIDFFELGSFTDQARHHESLEDASGQVKIDLHFRLLVPSMHYRMEESDLDWFWGQTEDLVSGSSSFRVLKPEANLLHLCAHIMLQNMGEDPDLLHLLDLHLLVSHSTLDWEIIVKQAAVLRWTYAVEKALGLLPGLFGTQLPEGLLVDLCRHRPAEEILPANQGILRRTRRWQEWRQAFGNMKARDRLRLILATLSPPQTFIRRLYGLSPEEPLFKYYIFHFFDGCREAALALHWKPDDKDRSIPQSKDIL